MSNKYLSFASGSLRLHTAVNSYLGATGANSLLALDGGGEIPLTLVNRIAHSALSGLTGDDHSQYVHTSIARTITAAHTISNTTPSTSSTTGALVISGGLGVGGEVNSGGVITGTRLVSNIAIGTAPVSVTSTTLCTNLNADLLDGQDGGFYQNASNLVSGTLNSARLPTSGVAAGTYRSVTVDTYGRVTAGTNPTTLSGYGITDALNTSSATQSKAGNLYITSTTASTSSSTGAFVVGGGMGVVGSIYTTNMEIEGGNTNTPSISLTSNDLRWISFKSFLRAAPSFTTRSVGTKLALYTNLTESSTDYAIGVELNALWFSVSQNSDSFKWYGGTTLAATLTGTGNLTLNGSTASTSSTTGALVVTGGLGVGGAINGGSTVTGTRLISNIATGTAPLSVSSTTVCTNLNADLLDDQHGSYYLNTSATTQSKSGILNLTATTSSTSTTTGALVVSGGVGIGGVVNAANLTAVGGLRACSGSNAIRITDTGSIGGTTGYGVIHHFNGADYYILLTNNNDALGSWNSFRPFIVNVATGNVSMEHTVTVGTLAGTGNRAVYSTSTGALTNSSSDRTLKKNITDLNYGLEDVLKLNPVSYQWRDESKLGSQVEIGLIAQDVKEVIPEVVGENSDGTLSIDYPKLVAVLINAIKELAK